MAATRPGKAPPPSSSPVGDGSGGGMGLVGADGTLAAVAAAAATAPAAGVAAAVTTTGAAATFPAAGAAADSVPMGTTAAATAIGALEDAAAATVTTAADAVDAGFSTPGAGGSTPSDVVPPPLSLRSRLSVGRRAFPPVPPVRVPSMASQDLWGSPRTGGSSSTSSTPIRRSHPSSASPDSGSVARQPRRAVRSARGGAGGSGRSMNSLSDTRPPSTGCDRRTATLFGSPGSCSNIGDTLITCEGEGSGGGSGTVSVGVGRGGRRGFTGAWSPSSGSLISSPVSSPMARQGRVLRSTTSPIPPSPTSRSSGGEEGEGSPVSDDAGNESSTDGGRGDGEAATAPAEDGGGAWSEAANGSASARVPQRQSPPTPFVPCSRLSVVSPYVSSGDSHGSDAANGVPLTSSSSGSLRRRMRRLFHKPVHLLGVHDVLHRHASNDGETHGSGSGHSMFLMNGWEPPSGEGGALADSVDPLMPWPTTLIRRTASLLLPHGGGGWGGHGPSAGVIDSPPDTPGEPEVTIRRRLSVLSLSSLWGGDEAVSADEAQDVSSGAGAEEAPPTRQRRYGHLQRATKAGGARKTALHTPTVSGGGAALSRRSRHSSVEEILSRWDVSGGPEATGLSSSRQDRPHASSSRRAAEAPVSPTTAARMSGRLGVGAAGGGGAGDGAGGKYSGRERPKDTLGGWKRGVPVSYGALALSGGEPGHGRRPLPSKARTRYRSTSTPALPSDRRNASHRRVLSAPRSRQPGPIGGDGGRDGSAPLGGAGVGGGVGGGGGGGGGGVKGGGAGTAVGWHADRPRPPPTTLSAQCENSSRKAAAFEFSVASSERMLNSLVSIENT